MPNAVSWLAGTLLRRHRAHAAVPPCTRSCPSDTAANPNLCPLGHIEAIAEAALAHHGWSRPVRRRAPLPCHHGRRRGSSDDPPGQSSIPVDARENGEHDVGNLTTGELAIDELLSVNHHALLCLADAWAR